MASNVDAVETVERARYSYLARAVWYAGKLYTGTAFMQMENENENEDTHLREEIMQSCVRMRNFNQQQLFVICSIVVQLCSSPHCLYYDLVKRACALL